MRLIEPKLFLMGRTEPYLPGIRAYLEDVGANLDAPIPRRLIGGGVDLSSEYELQDPVQEDDPPEVLPAETITEFYGRLCYRSFEPGLNANVSRVREDSRVYFENIMASKHGSVLEHASFNFTFRQVSRVFTHELVRHRAGTAISQESMRFVRLTDIPFWFPSWAQVDEELFQRSVNLLGAMEDHQEWMAAHFQLDEPGVPFAEKKAKTSFMRRFAPDGVATEIGWTANVRALRHCISMRTDEGAEEEIRFLFDMVAGMMVRQAPLLFGDFERSPEGMWTTPFWKV